ncbi:EAL domain-containing protein [Citrobacter freundii]|uniref:EAL domain-containing protein n=1 Tax=Citrobacter freundii TaxID=546 RepID=UPI00388F82B0|nr:EAL domain-containing protein [Citrobacter freundii]HCC5830956.1 EAL domain-containing protein [Citrobacter freundii]HCC5972139.1 EAL domain-containing protein [Citrobacter freundii]HCC7723502.1 EAL domain-containing protein [Citrobacter freundii]HCC7929079.1 EAL domain-containing protein [Citrobacter freundii]
MLRRSSSSDRKLLLTCAITGIVVALLVSSLQFFMSWHQRNAKYDTLTSNIQNYIESFFADLETTTNTLQPLVKDTCSQASAQLTSSAAFSLNVRAFLLVKDGIAFCSSATGSMNTPLQQLVPVLDMTKDIDMDLQPGTPMMPNKPAILIWYRNHSLQNSGVFATLNVNLAPYLLYNARQDDFNGVALVVGKTAITTLRWHHPTTGEIPPDAFIHYAESQKMIVPLTQHLFKLIAQDAPTLQKVLPAGAKLGINIAPTHLHGETFKDDIQRLYACLPANYFQLVLEITERDMLHQNKAIELFEWLHSAGFEIAIDDFGTGHSALIYLERFTVDYLKIDRGFINAIGTETLTSPVLDAVLTLSKRLNMLTVAEGVETPEQARWLRERGVHFFQGYWISRPLKLADFVRWMAQPNKPTW